mgnify:FL=1
MPQTIVQVDAFCDRIFQGNPAAVCVMGHPADAGWMQAVAAEMNLSETAFLYPIEGGYHLRWFTPTAEVDVCGHATLASAHVLWSECHVAASTLHFQTRSGQLVANQQQGWITLDFPSNPVQPVKSPPELLKSLRGVEARFIGKSSNMYLVELPSEDYVCSLQPDFTLMQLLPVMGVIVTSRSNSSEFDFVSRFFAPAIGINEDPVTGAAHCVLTPYWQGVLGKTAMVAYQASHRGGVLRLELAGSRTRISGQAVTVMRGQLVHH